MDYFRVPKQSRYFLALAISMIICLLLLINIAFKIIEIDGFLFSIGSVLCPMIAILYLLSLQYCTRTEQKHILNFCLMALYAFSMGIYLLINLPAAEYMHNNPAYQIVFENIPKKFFAATVSFGLSIYFPHWFYTHKTDNFSYIKESFFVMAMGLVFFSLHFYLLFMDVNLNAYEPIFKNSFLVSFLILLGMVIIYLSFHFLSKDLQKKLPKPKLKEPFPLYACLVCVAVVVLLICLVCEYRLISFWQDWNVAASGLLFPLAVIVSTLITELYGFKANLRFTLILILSQLAFDGLLIAFVELPSPDFYNINSFYAFIIPRRLTSASIAILATFLTNGILLHYLGNSKLAMQRITRIVISNICATSVLCMVNYSLLYGGIYPYDNLVHLALNVWVCKVAISLISLPLILWMYWKMADYIGEGSEVS